MKGKIILIEGAVTQGIEQAVGPGRQPRFARGAGRHGGRAGRALSSHTPASTAMDASGRDSVLTLPPEVLKLTHQLEQEKLESLTRRYDVLRKENELLKTRLEKSATAA